mgnify:CR=1 FL=1
MTQFKKSLSAWNSQQFDEIFKQEVLGLTLDELPLQQGLVHGSYAISDDLGVMVNQRQEDDTSVLVVTGIFYKSVIAGCNCADDPTPVDTLNEYCELSFRIDKKTANTEIELLQS